MKPLRIRTRTKTLHRPLARHRPSTTLLQRLPYTRTYATEQQPPPFSARELSNIRTRIGACCTFGLTSHEQHALAGKLSREIATGWRELIAGSEGYLTRGLLEPEMQKVRTEERGVKHARDMERWCKGNVWKREVIWGEQDTMNAGHVNNVMYNRWAETSRIAWTYSFIDGGETPEEKRAWSHLGSSQGDAGLILQSITTKFSFPVSIPDRVTAFHKIQARPDPDSDTLIFDVIILSEQHRRVAARCLEHVVFFNYQNSQKVKLGSLDFMLQAFQRRWDAEQEARRINTARAIALREGVVELEKSSWDRPGAKEQ